MRQASEQNLTGFLPATCISGLPQLRQQFEAGTSVVPTAALVPVSPAAVGRDLILGQAERISNIGVSVPGLTELRDFVFLFVCHSDLQSEGLSFSSH